MSVFEDQSPHIAKNEYLRVPQVEAYEATSKHFSDAAAEREVSIILPVGCGKSGVITLLPFGVRARRVLVIAPGLKIAEQLHNDFDPSKGSFYQRAKVLDGPPYPEPVDVKSGATNKTDLEEADVVVANIQQLQGADNRWLNKLPDDFFDLILVDEGHHNVAASWEALRKKFPAAKIVNLSATPARADGQVMAGKIIYSFPIAEAIRLGYIKHLKGLVLNPSSLRFVRREGDDEIEVTLDEVKRLGEEDADFRRSIVTSKATLNTIVDASLRELDRLRTETGEKRLKIIASALNYEHCIQVVEAYNARGRRAAFVHAREASAENQRVLKKLENHELDVIVQVRKLGEGFDHPYLSVAAVFSVFANLSPFVQFVGRIMRVIEQNKPDSPLNHGTVVFHAGGNIARHWTDFQAFSKADQEYFDQLLPLEGLEFTTADELTVDPTPRVTTPIEIRAQEGVSVEEVPLLESAEARAAFETLVKLGMTPEQFRTAYDLQPVPTTKVGERRAARAALDQEIKRVTGKILKDKKINPEGHDMDKQFRGLTNFVIVKSAIDKRVNAIAGHGTGERGELTRDELEAVKQKLPAIAEEVAATLPTNG